MDSTNYNWECISDINLLHEATRKAIGGMSYIEGFDRARWEKARDMAGFTKGQWKRFQISSKKGSYGLKCTPVQRKRLMLMIEHPDSPHLMTLLRMVEAQMGVSDE